MPYVETLEAEIAVEQVVQVETKPVLDSLDSGQEFSLDHLRQLYRLLEAENHELDGYLFDDSCLHVA